MKPVLSSKYMKCAHRSCVSLREQDKAIPMVGSLGNKAPHYRAGQKARAFSQEQQVRQVWGEVTPRRRMDGMTQSCFSTLPHSQVCFTPLKPNQAVWEFSR